MSFILDALKKSEHERQRQTIPGLVESVVARPKPRLPTWAVVLCALLGINLIVLMVVLMRGEGAPPRVQRTAIQPRDARIGVAPPSDMAAPDTDADSEPAKAARREDAGAPGDKHFSPLDNSPVYAPEIPVASAAATAPPATQQQATTGSSGEHSIRRRDPLLNDDDYKAVDEEALPSINELNLTGAQSLPELHLDVHVYATRSAERFVFINMRKYHEGATMQEGPTIERIRRDGVILNYKGLRFLLPRQ
jgi:general secretion pathway protein B